MDPIAAVGSALGSLKSGIDLARGALDAKIEAEVRGKVVDAMDALISAQTQLLDARLQMHDLIDENRKLKRELEEREDWKKRADSYQLVQAAGSAMVYEFKGQPPHYACPACYEKKQIFPLQDRHLLMATWECPNCGKTFRVGVPRNSPPRAPDGGGPGGWMAS